MTSTEVRVAFAGEQPGRPPIVTVLLDVTLHNPEAAPRWYLVPARFGAGEDLHGGSVHTVEVRAGQGVRVAQFSGLTGFHAVLVPAGGEVVISGLPVELWYDEPPAALHFDIASVGGLAIGRESGEAWLGGAASDGRAAYDALALVASRSSPDLDELPVGLTGERRLPVTVSLSAP